MKYGTAKLKVPVVVKPQIEMTAATPSLRTFRELSMQTVDIVCGQSQMLAVTSRPESSQMRLGSEKPQSHKFIPVFSPDAAPNSTPIQEAKPVASARCKSVRKLHANLPDTPLALTSASKYFQMLPAPPGALQCALRLCRSICRCSSKHLQ